jgi:hypothetical protein
VVVRARALSNKNCFNFQKDKTGQTIMIAIVRGKNTGISGVWGKNVCQFQKRPNLSVYAGIVDYYVA